MVRRALLLLTVTAALATAQSASWPTTHQQALWLTTSVEHELTDRTSLWFDGSWRRMGFGAEPQQVLLRPGILHTIAPGVRVGAGYTYVATQPYGELPSATPLREHRLWQDIRFASTHGSLALTHRYRWEQRWIAPVASGGTGDFVYQQRARVMVRAQAPLASLTYRARAVTWYLQEELLMPVGHDGATGRLAQNRALVGVGVPLTPRQRLDVGYQNLWNALPSRSANEVNHTLTFSWVVTSGR
jgi:hypothetical protein